MTTAKVYAAIAAVTAEMGHEGIGKTRKNQQQGYNFRGIDDVYNALSPVLAKHKLCILPRILAREVVERQSAKGGALFYTTVEAEFDFVSAEDGSKHTVRTFGEAMDSADKSTNKAMSAAYKYAAMQAFCIPTEGDNDADAVTHEVAPQPAAMPEGIEPEEGWAMWALGLMGHLEAVENEAAINAARDDGDTKRRINALKTIDRQLYDKIGVAFADARARLAPQKKAA